MDRDEVEVHKLAKKEQGQYPAILTEQTWSIKDLLYGFWGNFACGIQRVVPSGQDGSILPDLVHLACSRNQPYNNTLIFTDLSSQGYVNVSYKIIHLQCDTDS